MSNNKLQPMTVTVPNQTENCPNPQPIFLRFLSNTNKNHFIIKAIFFKRYSPRAKTHLIASDVCVRGEKLDKTCTHLSMPSMGQIIPFYFRLYSNS